MAKVTGEWIQLVGLAVVGVGCGIELAVKASIGLVIITMGSIAFAIGTKLKGR